MGIGGKGYFEAGVVGDWEGYEKYQPIRVALIVGTIMRRKDEKRKRMMMVFKRKIWLLWADSY